MRSCRVPLLEGTLDQTNPSFLTFFESFVWRIIYLQPSSPLLLVPLDFFFCHRPITLVCGLADTPIPRLKLHTDTASASCESFFFIAALLSPWVALLFCRPANLGIIPPGSRLLSSRRVQRSRMWRCLPTTPATT
ncbi:hypothetical protein BJY01DRAFT_85351 [Aspergillus pseudoustus]|uniref:Uncharacterized protein n=1 Tax=Aspergillus pseudoustus TaxID=1810923 RepID=A0ABR4J2P2_9EURO